jgi:hypothetical protein
LLLDVQVEENLEFLVAFTDVAGMEDDDLVAYCFRLTLGLYRAIPACAPMVGPMLRPMKKLNLPHKWNAMPGCQDPVGILQTII